MQIYVQKVWSTDNESFFFKFFVTGEGFTKCTGVNVGLTNICSMLTKMDCYNAGGGCCATYSDGTGTVSIAEKTSEELCGYCFTGEPGTLEATLEGTEWIINVCYSVILRINHNLYYMVLHIHCGITVLILL